MEESSYVKAGRLHVGLYNRKLAAAGKSWWMTEHLFNDGEKEQSRLVQFHDWSHNLETLAQEIHMHGGHCSAYIYWYLKRFYA